MTDPDRLRAAEFEARDEAAPFAVAAAAAFGLLGFLSHRAGWELAHGVDWRVWLAAAVPHLLLAMMLLAGLGRVATRDVRRRAVQVLLAGVLVTQLAVVVLLVASLVDPAPGRAVTGAQLLTSAVIVWFTDTVAFGLLYWELDCGGPVRRALHDRRSPDFQFPQDENPGLARPGWRPALVDYVYVSLTNSIAFSPTDAMPLTRAAKGAMAIESVLSVVAVLVVAARAVNILTG